MKRLLLIFGGAVLLSVGLQAQTNTTVKVVTYPAYTNILVPNSVNNTQFNTAVFPILLTNVTGATGAGGGGSVTAGTNIYVSGSTVSVISTNFIIKTNNGNDFADMYITRSNIGYVLATNGTSSVAAISNATAGSQGMMIIANNGAGVWPIAYYSGGPNTNKQYSWGSLGYFSAGGTLTMPSNSAALYHSFYANGSLNQSSAGAALTVMYLENEHTNKNTSIQFGASISNNLQAGLNAVEMGFGNYGSTASESNAFFINTANGNIPFNVLINNSKIFYVDTAGAYANGSRLIESANNGLGFANMTLTRSNLGANLIGVTGSGAFNQLSNLVGVSQGQMFVGNNGDGIWPIGLWSGGGKPNDIVYSVQVPGKFQVGSASQMVGGGGLGVGTDQVQYWYFKGSAALADITNFHSDCNLVIANMSQYDSGGGVSFAGTATNGLGQHFVYGSQQASILLVQTNAVGITNGVGAVGVSVYNGDDISKGFFLLIANPPTDFMIGQPTTIGGEYGIPNHARMSIEFSNSVVHFPFQQASNFNHRVAGWKDTWRIDEINGNVFAYGNISTTNGAIYTKNGLWATNLTASRALISDANSGITNSVTTSAELSFVSGVTSALQTQINNLTNVGGLQVYASNVVSGGQLPVGTVATNAGVQGQFLMYDAAGRTWTNNATTLTNLNASELRSGTVPSARLPGITNLVSGANNVVSATNASDASIYGHLRLVGNGSVPTIVTNAGTGAGGSAGPTITGSDQAGYITISTGGTPTVNTNVCTITFGTAFNKSPTVVLTPAADKSIAHTARWGILPATSTTFCITNTATALQANTTYTWSYLVIETP